MTLLQKIRNKVGTAPTYIPLAIGVATTLVACATTPKVKPQARMLSVVESAQASYEHNKQTAIGNIQNQLEAAGLERDAAEPFCSYTIGSLSPYAFEPISRVEAVLQHLESRGETGVRGRPITQRHQAGARGTQILVKVDDGRIFDPGEPQRFEAHVGNAACRAFVYDILTIKEVGE
jgi:hypothetical protein